MAPAPAARKFAYLPALCTVSHNEIFQWKYSVPGVFVCTF